MGINARLKASTVPAWMEERGMEEVPTFASPGLSIAAQQDVWVLDPVGGLFDEMSLGT